MTKFRNLSSFDQITFVMFEPGMGGTFIANLLNIADAGLDKSTIERRGKISMFAPVGGYDEEEYPPMFHSGKFLFRGINELSFDHDIDLMLSDIEIRTLYDINRPADDGNSPDYFSLGTPTVNQKSIYLPMHVPKGKHPDIAVQRVRNYAKVHGVNLRFIACTMDGESAGFWMHRRSIRLGIQPERPYEELMEHYHGSYRMVFRFNEVIDLNLDRYFNGDIDHLVSRIQGLVTSMENHEIVRSRALAFWKNKMYHTETPL